MKAKAIMVGVVAALIGLIWVAASYQDWRLQYLFSHGRYEEYLKEAPRNQQYEQQRLLARARRKTGQSHGCAQELVQS